MLRLSTSHRYVIAWLSLSLSFSLSDARHSFFFPSIALRLTVSILVKKRAGGTFNSAKDIIKRLKEMKESGGKWGKKVKKDKQREAEYGKVGAQGWLLG